MKIIILKKKKIIITILIIMFLNFLAINFAPEIITSFAFEKKKYSIGNEEIPVSAFAAIEPMYTYSNARIKKDPE